MVPNSDAASPAATTPAVAPSISAIKAENALMDLRCGKSAREHMPISAVAMPNGTNSSAVYRLAAFAFCRVSTVLMGLMTYFGGDGAAIPAVNQGRDWAP